MRALKTARAADRAASISYLRDLVGTEDDPARIALDLARDPTVDVRLRIDCALGLVPFVHPKLSYAEANVRHTTVKADASTVILELEARLDRIGRSSPIIEAAADTQSDAERPVIGSFPASSGIGQGSVSAPCPQEAAE